MENEIYFARYKESFSDRIIKQNNEWVVKRTWKVKGYDSLLSIWVTIPEKSRSRILPVSDIFLFKELTQVIYIRRNSQDEFLKNISVYLKLTRKIEVINKKSSLFLTESNFRIFQTNFSVTAPLNYNYTPEGISITNLKEEKLSTKELQQLNEDLANPKVYVKPQIIEELQNGERRLLVN